MYVNNTNILLLIDNVYIYDYSFGENKNKNKNKYIRTQWIYCYSCVHTLN